MRLNLIPIPPRPYGTDALRYELRMRPFLTVDLPDFVHFEEFKALIEMKDEPVSRSFVLISDNTLDTFIGADRIECPYYRR